MPSSTESWGIEVGSHAIKAIHLEKSGQQAKLLDFEVIPHKKVLSTPDTDIDEAIRVGLAQFASKHPIGNASVVVSVPGTMAFARFAKLPPVEPKRVPDIVKFEAIQQIPFPIDQVEWDYQVFQQPDSPDVEVGIFAITKERVMTWLSHFDAAGIPVHGVTLSPVAVYNAMAFDLDLTPQSPGSMLVDIGTLSTDLIIAEEGRVWLRTLPIGGHHFTEAVARSFKLNYSKAEKIKKEAATSKYARQIFQAMRPVFVDLVGEIQKSLGYYQSLNRDASVKSIVGMGSTFRLAGLQKFIKQQLQIDAVRLDSFKKIDAGGRDAASFAESASSLAPAYGLALQGLEMEEVSANILPAATLKHVIWKNKKWWNVAAAATLAVAAVIPVTRLMADKASYASSKQQHGGTISSAVAAAEGPKQEYESVQKDDPRPQIDSLRSIHDYADLWPLLMLDIQRALQSVEPQPVLFTNDVEEIKKIERGQRRLVRIEEITPQFFPTGQRGGTGAGGPGGGVPFGGPTAAPSAGGEGDSAEGSGSGEAPMPLMVITVTGTTPYTGSTKTQNEAVNLIADTVIKWLNENGRDNKRPYEIIEAKGLNYDSAADTGQLNQATFSPGGGGRFPSAPRGGGLFGGTPAAPTGAPPPGGTRITPRTNPAGNPGGLSSPSLGGTGVAGSVDLKQIEDYFPKPPFEDEKDAVNDTRFVMEFQVRFRPPKEARLIQGMTEQEYEAYKKEAAKKAEGEAPADGAEPAENAETEPPATDVPGEGEQPVEGDDNEAPAPASEEASSEEGGEQLPSEQPVESPAAEPGSETPSENAEEAPQ